MYNSQSCKGCLLSCLHTVCETCFAYYSSQPCPICHIPNTRPLTHKTPDYSLMEILENEEIPCENEGCKRLATSLCTTHWKAACETCAQLCKPTCSKLDFHDTSLDISGYLYKELSSKRHSVPQFAERHFRVIGTLSNTRKLQLIRSLYLVPYCEHCKEPAQTAYYFLNPGSFYCHNCACQLCSSGKLEQSYIPLNSVTETPLMSLKSHVVGKMRMVDVFTVSPCVELYRLLRDSFHTGSLYDLQTITRLTFSLTNLGYSSDKTLCPGCCITFPTNIFLLLPCREARHALCQSCITRQSSRDHKVECPLDKLMFQWPPQSYGS